MESIGSYKDNRRDNRYSSQSDNESKKNDRFDSRRDNQDVAKIDRLVKRRRDRDKTTFTPLNSHVSKNLNKIKSKPRFVQPPKMKMPDYKKTSDQYHDYHQDKGHNTYKCFHLKKLIDKMVKDGDLNQHVNDLRDQLDFKDGKKKSSRGVRKGGKDHIW